MVYGCGNNLVKVLVFTFNFLIFICGAVVFGVSLWFNLDKNGSLIQELKTDMHIDDLSQYTTAIWILAVVGGFLMVTGFLGCCGAASESRCLLGLFFIIVLVCFLTELGSGIAAVAFKDSVKDGLARGLNDTWATSKLSNDTSFVKLEIELDCCGVFNTNGTDEKYCKDVQYKDKSVRQHQGCLDALWDEISGYSTIVGGIALAVLAVELLAMIFSCCMCSAIKEKQGYTQYA